MGYTRSITDDEAPISCVFDRKPLETDDEQSRGVCRSCWVAVGSPSTRGNVSAKDVAEVVKTAPAALQASLRALGATSRMASPEASWRAMEVAMYHGAVATSFGASSIDTVVDRVDESKEVVAAAYNLARALGYGRIADRLLLRFDREGLVRFRDTEKGLYEVHTPYDERWNVMSRNDRKTFFGSPRKDGEFWWRAFHNSELRTVVNMLQGVFSDRFALGINGKLFPLPAMPLPKEDDFGKAPTGKPRATGEGPVPDIYGIRLNDTIQLPEGGTAIVQYINPRKSSIGVGNKGERYTFYSFDAVETANGKVVAARLEEERKKAARDVGGGPTGPVADLSSRKIPKEMKDYQVESLAFIEKNRRVILATEQGLGKSLIASIAIDEPAIIVCPAGLKSNWVDKELPRWRPDLTSRVLNVSGGAMPDVSERKRATVIVLNYDIVEKHLPWLVKLGAKTLIADEAQYLKNLRLAWNQKKREYEPTENSPRRANAFYELQRYIPKLVLMTGTPIMNRTKELFPLLHFCNREEWGSQTNFEKEFCGAQSEVIKGRQIWNANGRTNTEELHKRVTSKYMIRHTKEMVARELPAKSRQTVVVELSEKSRRQYVQLCRDFLSWVFVHGGPLKAASAMRAEALTRMTAMRRVSANGKVEATLDWIKTHLTDTGYRPLIVAGVHSDALGAIGAGLDEMNREFERQFSEPGVMPDLDRKIRWGTILGSDSAVSRKRTVSEFQDKGSIDVLLFSTPIGVGLTLTRSQDMVFLERMWRPSDQVQMEDRVHRIGQTNAVTITYLDGQGTIDAKIGMLLMDKADTAEQVINGRTLTDAEIFYQIFGDMIGKDGQRIDVSKMQSVDDLADIMDQIEMDAAEMERDLANLVKARQEMERQKERAERSDSEAGRESQSREFVSVEEYAKKLSDARASGQEAPSAFLEQNRRQGSGDETFELYLGHAADHEEYLRRRSMDPNYDAILDSMVIDSWDQPF